MLRDTALPSAAPGVSLFASNLGVEIGQAVIVLAGAYWFVERVLQGRA